MLNVCSSDACANVTGTSSRHKAHNPLHIREHADNPAEIIRVAEITETGIALIEWRNRLHICLQERKIKDIEVLRHARFVHRLGNSHYPTLDQLAKCHLCSRLTVLRRLLLFHYHTPERYQSSCNRPQAHPAHIIPLRVVKLERLRTQNRHLYAVVQFDRLHDDSCFYAAKVHLFSEMDKKKC